MKKCQKCGTYVEDEMNFCVECGAKVYDRCVMQNENMSVNISLEDGTLNFTENIVIKKGMKFEYVEAMRINMSTSYAYVKSNAKSFIAFPPNEDIQNGLWLEVYFLDNRVFAFDLYAPFLHAEIPIPLSKDMQKKYLYTIIGKDFLDYAFLNGKSGNMTWGNVSILWNCNKGDGKLRLHIEYK